MIFARTNSPLEFSLTSGCSYRDIFNDIEVDVIFTGPDGSQWTVPAFWAGGDVFRIRFAPPAPGRYTYRSRCSNSGDSGLHGRTGEIETVPYEGQSVLYQRGRLSVADSKRTLEHADGAPFLWLGDTWWFGLNPRLDWPHGFKRLTEDRARKGFSVVLIVVGPYPEFMPEQAWHPDQANEGGWSWERDWARINPRYFDMADLRIAWLVERGLVPCILPTWGYFGPIMGLERAKKHWRYLVARYGAYPVVWAPSGEQEAPGYGTPPEKAEEVSRQQKELWTEVARYLREIDPYHNPVTSHPAGSARQAILDDSLLDINMLQTGHSGYTVYEATIRNLKLAREMEPRMPTLVGEVGYENILGTNHADAQRFFFWGCLTSGACGHTYGAQGVWGMAIPDSTDIGYSGCSYSQTNRWGEGVWEEAMNLPGSEQVGLGRRFFERYPWHLFEPLEVAALKDAGRVSSFATGIPGAVSVFYVVNRGWMPELQGIRVGRKRVDFVPIEIESGARYHAYFHNPRTGQDTDLGQVEPGPDGVWSPPEAPTYADWALVLEDREALERMTKK